MVLLQRFGVMGAAASTGIGLLAGYACVAGLLQFKVGLDMGRYFAGLARGLAPVALACLATGAALDRWVFGGWAGLVVCAVVYSAIYAVLMFAFGMNPYERDLVRRVAVRLTPARMRRGPG